MIHETRASVNTKSLIDVAVSALMQTAVLGGLSFGGYFIYHKCRHKRSFSEIAQRSGDLVTAVGELDAARVALAQGGARARRPMW